MVRWLNLWLPGLSLLLLVLVFPGCGKEDRPQDFVARVGTSLLTADDLLVSGGVRSDSSLAARNYINEWVSTELLYQEAIRRNLDNTEAVQKRVRDVSKRLAIEALLDEVLYQDSSEISEEKITGYFADHQSEFTLAEDVALVSLALFDERGAANTFRSGIVRGSSWDQATGKIQDDTLVSPHLLQLSDRKYYTASTLFPEELWKVARTITPSSVSFVITTDAGYYVLFLHEFRKTGQPADLPYVAHEIHGRLLMAGRREKYDALVRDLRSRFPVEVRPFARAPEVSQE